VALLHAWRFGLDLPLQIGAWDVPSSLSGWAAIGATFLSAWAFKSARVGKTARVAYT
jgi:hypothetical protein